MLSAVDWIYANAIAIPNNAPSSIQAVFLNTYTGVGSPRDQWIKVDLNNELPDNTVAVHLTGQLIITHGLTNEIADLMIYFRKNETIKNVIYSHQVIEASIGDGQRSAMACWVPVSDDKSFEYKWHVKQLGNYPEYSAYGINLKIDAIALNK